MPGHFVEEAGRVCLGLPVHSSGVPRPSQLHSAQQAQGPSHQLIVTASELLHVNLNINWDVSNLYLFFIFIFLRLCFPLRSVKQLSKVCAPSSEEVTSCSQIMHQPITQLQWPQPSSAWKKWSKQEVRQHIYQYVTICFSFCVSVSVQSWVSPLISILFWFTRFRFNFRFSYLVKYESNSESTGPVLSSLVVKICPCTE